MIHRKEAAISPFILLKLTLALTQHNTHRDNAWLQAKNVLLAPGGYPIFPEGPGISTHAISSDGFFELESLPSKAVVVGAGYIAVELAGVLKALGTDVTLVLRKEKALREFDDLLRDTLDSEMLRQGINILRNTGGVESISLDGEGLKKVSCHDGSTIDGVDCVLMATGRAPLTEPLGLEEAGVKQGPRWVIQIRCLAATMRMRQCAICDCDNAAAVMQ